MSGDNEAAHSDRTLLLVSAFSGGQDSVLQLT
jgi:hypothetical protein